MEARADIAALRAARTDPAAFAPFYRRHAERVLRYFTSRTSAPELAADLMAETFATALANVHRYRERGGPPVAWLFGIARNLLIDAYRRGQVGARARQRLALEPLVLDDADIARIDELASLPEAEALLADLSADESAAVRARVIDERSYSDIAAELDCSPAVVRQRVSRGLARLRASLEGEA
ncbi:MAG: RNA polymerase sigma factor [Solirubrobacteraceae bacterium]|nr:RNA polymerase sigma factor [Patulibacter sp.]